MIVFFVVSVVNNKALSYNVPVPLHIIFRSVRPFLCRCCQGLDWVELKGTLLASMVLGKVILKKSYSRHKYAAVAMVTLGILICTFASSRQLKVGPLSPWPGVKCMERGKVAFRRRRPTVSWRR